MSLNLVLSGILSVSSTIALAKPAPLAFDTSTFSKLKSGTVAQVFCADPKTYQLKSACADLKKSKEDLNLKIQAIEFESKSSFVIRHGKMTIKVSRTDRPTVFEVNHKEIDFADYGNFKELENAIASSFPKFSKILLLMNFAYAQTSGKFGAGWGPTDEMAKTIALMMMATSDKDICNSAKEVVNQCRTYPEVIADSKTLVGLFNSKPQAENGLMTIAQKKQIETAMDRFNVDIDRLYSNLFHVKNRMIDVLRFCPSVQGGENAFTDLGACQMSLREAQDRMKDLSWRKLAQFRGTVDDFGLMLKSELSLSQPKSQNAPASGQR